MTSNLKSRRDLMVKLRDDAAARGMLPLAIAYGIEAVRLGQEMVMDEARKFKERMQRGEQSS